MAQLYEQVKGFIRSVAWKYRRNGEMEDLEQEGYLALYDAVDGYDAAQGASFLTYAGYHLHNRMRRYLQTNGRVLRLPIGQEENIRRYERFCSAYYAECGAVPSEDEIATSMGISLEQARKIQKNASVAVVASLDSPVGGENDVEGVLGDVIASGDDLEEEMLERIRREQLKAELWRLVDALPERQAAVLRKHYQRGMTLQEIGQQYGISQETVRYEERKAIRQMQRPFVRCCLLPYLDDSMLYSRALHGTGAKRFAQTWTSSTEREALRLAEGCTGATE